MFRKRHRLLRTLLLPQPLSGDKKQGMEGIAHRLGWPAGRGRVDHTVLLDGTQGGLPAHAQSVGGGVEHMDVLHSTALHW